jgi:hypothetical protein
MDPFSLMMLSTGFNALSAIGGAKAESNAAKFNAAMAERNAAIARDQGQAELIAQRRHGAKAIGGMRAAYGAAGVTLEGSPLDVLEESVSQTELERQNIGYNTELRAQGYQAEANLNRARASNAMAGGYLKAASSLLTGGGASAYGRGFSFG